MDEQHKMRASDRDRQQVVDRLRSALEDGRLTMDEYVDRMEVAYQAATYGDLAPLCADLPAPAPVVAGPATAAGATAPPAASPAQATWPDCRRCSRSCGSIWLAAVSVNVVDLGPGQRHRRSPGLPLAGLGCRSVRGGAVRRVSWRQAVPAQPAARRAPAAGEWLTRSRSPARRPRVYARLMNANG